MSEVQQSVMTREAAERLTERIRLTATTFMETRDKLAGLIREAQEGRAHEALGFPSWTAYVAAVCSDTPLMRLSRDERRVIVADLAEQGMSTRAIAPIVGKSVGTVHADRATGVQRMNTSPATPSEPTFDPTPAWDPTTGEVVETSTVTGLDGKTYSKPDPKEAVPVATHKRPRRPIYETTRVAITNLVDATEKLGIEIHDDRFPTNAEELTPMLRNQLTHVIETCQGYLDALNPNKE